MDKVQSKISVIVPVYNVEKYLEKCVNSLINQSYTDLEIILVDDGATDSSGAMCDELQKLDRRIKVIHKVNGGLSDARNTGIEIATGDYITFLDSDDYVHPDLYQNLYRLIIEKDCDVAICNYEYVDEEGKGVYPISDVLKDEVITGKEALNKLMLDEGNFYYVTAWNKLYRKEIFKEIRFPKGKVHEDEYVAHRVLDKCSKVVTTKEVYIYYVQRQGSITNKGINVKKLDCAWAFYDRYKYCMEIGEKEVANYALRQSYAVVLTCIEGLDKKTYKKEIKDIMWTVIRALGCNPRSVKLLLAYLKKR